MRFTYVAATPQGKTVRGDLDAVTIREAIRTLRSQGFLLQDVRPTVRTRSLRERLAAPFGRVSLLQIALLARHLALLLRAGITIDRAFEILAGQATRKSVRSVLLEVLESIRHGESLAASLARHPQVFPQRFVAMVQWGEVGGRLSESLEHLALQLERDRELQSKVRGAMVYPSIIIAAIIIVGTVMSFMIMPQLAQIIQDFDVELPLLTRVFITVANALTKYGLLVGVVGALGWLFFLFLIRHPQIVPTMHALYLRIPIVGRIVQMVNLARMDRAFGSLIQSGIPIVESLKIVRGILGNVAYQAALTHAIDEVRKGVGLGRILQSSPRLFPRIETDMIGIGEETGKLSEVLLYLAEFYEGNVSQMTKNLAQTIEPILLLVVGVVVGFIVMAIMMPIYQISQAIV